MICRPLYKITASFNAIGIAASGSGTPEMNGITAGGLTSGQVYWIDSETMEMYNSDRSLILTSKTNGNFPVLGMGDNTITVSNISSVEILKRERYL